MIVFDELNLAWLSLVKQQTNHCKQKYAAYWHSTPSKHQQTAHPYFTQVNYKTATCSYLAPDHQTAP